MSLSRRQEKKPGSLSARGARASLGRWRLHHDRTGRVIALSGSVALTVKIHVGGCNDQISTVLDIVTFDCRPP